MSHHRLFARSKSQRHGQGRAISHSRLTGSARFRLDLEIEERATRGEGLGGGSKNVALESRGLGITSPATFSQDMSGNTHTSCQSINQWLSLSPLQTQIPQYRCRPADERRRVSKKLLLVDRSTPRYLSSHRTCSVTGQERSKRHSNLTVVALRRKICMYL
jgi:hypothetical protein